MLFQSEKNRAAHRGSGDPPGWQAHFFVGAHAVISPWKLRHPCSYSRLSCDIRPTEIPNLWATRPLPSPVASTATIRRSRLGQRGQPVGKVNSEGCEIRHTRRSATATCRHWRSSVSTDPIHLAADHPAAGLPKIDADVTVCTRADQHALPRGPGLLPAGLRADRDVVQARREIRERVHA